MVMAQDEGGGACMRSTWRRGDGSEAKAWTCGHADKVEIEEIGY